ncbi:MAG: efflux RND transporter periplasmic adaptor subunit, partial [Candidatus Hinthialibacter sp.]
MKTAINIPDWWKGAQVLPREFLSTFKPFFYGFFLLGIVLIGALEGRSEADALELEGFIKPFMEVDVGCEVTGVLKSLEVEKSDIVKKEQIIAQLDVSVEQQNVELARANLKLSEASIQLQKENMDFLFREFQRKNELYKKDSLSFFEKDQSETNWRIASLSLQEAIEKKRVAELELKQTSAFLQRRIIRSSINGVVVE